MTSFDRVAHCYDETRTIPPEVSAAVAASIAAQLPRAARPPSLLEVGIGTGRIAVPLADAGVDVVGIDIAPAMLARLRSRRPGLPVLRAAADRLPFAARAFDAVLFVHVLHLLPDAVAALRAARAATRTGGVLIYGREEFPEAPLEPIVRRMRQLAVELAGVAGDLRSPRERACTAFAVAAREADVEPREIVVTRWPIRTTGRQLLDSISGKIWSSTWDIPDAVMPEVVARLTPEVIDLVGDLDRPLVHDAAFLLTIAPCP
jgi:ubiquinone/menaquinone biosynthesis C-methylase UbiE